MGKLRGIPVLMLIALLASDAAAAQGSSTRPAPTVASPGYETIASPSSGTGLIGDGGGSLGGLQGDPDDLIDGNRAKPKIGANGTTGSGTTGGLLSNVITSVRLYGYFWLFGRMLR